ncbi:hypothetical protein BDW71DRAFT_195677 [Aspergillus fruticulosus]
MSTQPEINPLKTAHIFPSQKPTKTTVPSPSSMHLVFDAPCGGNEDELWQLDWPSGLQQSLAVTRSSFPPNYGYGGTDRTKRYGRLHITFGTDTDPGFEFSTARCGTALDEIVPDPAQRKSPNSRDWNLSCSANVFLPAGKKVSFIGGPSSSSPILIQVTQFGCGGVAVGIRIAHPLADVQTLGVFMKRWSFEHSILFLSESTVLEGVSTPETEPLTAGDINALSPDETILTKSYALPSPAATADEKWEAVGRSDLGVSRHDAIVAHVWSAINGARGLGSDELDVSLHYTFSLPQRLGLPSEFMGTPILLTSVWTPGKDAANARSSTSQKQNIATQIRSNLALYTTDALKARLHDLCFEVAPQRLWEAFLGYRHVIFTSWAHLGLYEREAKEGKGRHWCDNRVDVAVSIAAKAMERLKKWS